ncbi:MAG: hypothetical protein AVDCRST_MAG13-1663 [uncultured Solirubrobacteraceae bacterium]|uniref:Uncharacterized protein n=1 Tax=uncultured Solirubrobacteraceae bacterium TaxID=1162706 RepID=A0A6J4SBI4_9ACTN|nr:MAG: hypothetical protein AVDCRST_MAG13-1663 [uncultured Solirubrobacteraceae bacterium]
MQGVLHVGRARCEILEDRLAQRLGGNGARVDRDPADAVAPLHHPDALAELCRLDRRPLAARP